MVPRPPHPISVALGGQQQTRRLEQSVGGRRVGGTREVGRAAATLPGIGRVCPRADGASVPILPSLPLEELRMFNWSPNHPE